MIEPQSLPEVGSSDLDGISVTLQVDEPVDADARVFLGASSGASPLGHPIRIIPERKLSLLMALQRRLLFGGFPDSSELERALSLLQASFTHKLFFTGSAAAGEGFSGWDSASPAFADMLCRLRAAGGFHSAQPGGAALTLSATPTAAAVSSAPSVLSAAGRVAGGGFPPSTTAAALPVAASLHPDTPLPLLDAPWRDTSELGCSAALEAAAALIIDELQRVLARTAGDRRGDSVQGASVLRQGAGEGGSVGVGPTWDGADYTAIAPAWSVLHLWKGGAWQPDAEALMPRSVALLRAEEAGGRLSLNPLQNVACGIARQPASSGITRHCDGNVLGLTAHLGLVIPEGGQTWIEVGGERRAWREGRVMLFDTTFPHSTRNDATADRCALRKRVGWARRGLEVRVRVGSTTKVCVWGEVGGAIVTRRCAPPTYPPTTYPHRPPSSTHKRTASHPCPHQPAQLAVGVPRPPTAPLYFHPLPTPAKHILMLKVPRAPLSSPPSPFP